MSATIDLLTIRHRFSEFIAAASLDERILTTLRLEAGFLQKESELWDYKAAPSIDAAGLAKTVLQVVSFHNTYGGYLLYGIDDKTFRPSERAPQSIPVQQIADLVESYTGDRVDLSCAQIKVAIDGRDHQFGILHIPKRGVGTPVLVFGKNSPQKSNGEYVFKSGQTYLRHHNACIPATTTAHHQLLCGARVNHLLWAADGAPVVLAERVIDHNLPDKNFICQRFIGRERVMEELWRWLGDPFVRARVLAGDGGKGKTAIAYQFATDVCRVRPDGFEIVIWVTAKSQQYVGITDQYVPVHETHFCDTGSLLRALCTRLGVRDSEIDGASDALLKRRLQVAMGLVGCLIIVDDLDAISVDDQKAVMSLAQQVATPKARFLITTRMNLSYASDACISIAGLEPNDYAEFVRSWEERLRVRHLGKRKLEQMRSVTDGSPLFTESLLRLFCNGMNIEDAMREWRGRLGNEVRRAALQREVKQLSPESRRVLLACAAVGEVGFSELRQITGYDEDRMNFCVGELKALFLLSAPEFIKSEARFRVLGNTARLVLDMRSELVKDHALVLKTVERVRRGTAAMAPSQQQSGRVGAAVKQAVSLLHVAEFERALATVEGALKEIPKNADLLLTGGRCLLEWGRKEGKRHYFERAREWFEAARAAGQSKELLFDLWYESERRAGHSPGAVVVAGMALATDVCSHGVWFLRRASAHMDQAKAHRQANSPDACLLDLQHAGEDARAALGTMWSEHENVSEFIAHVSDEMLAMAMLARRELGTFLTALDCLVENVRKGDVRPSTVAGMVRCCEEVVQLLAPEGELGTKAQSLLEYRLRQVEGALKSLGRQSRRGADWQALSRRMEQLRDNVTAMTQRVVTVP